jgi:hypothetical protein
MAGNDNGGKSDMIMIATTVAGVITGNKLYDAILYSTWHLLQG